MEYERCDIFQPDDGRAAKRRRTNTQGLHASWDFRRKVYEATWRRQQSLIDSKLGETNASTAAEVLSFLDEAVSNRPAVRIPTGIILAGPNAASQASITSHVSRAHSDTSKRIVVPLSSASGSNLKAILKALIQKATARTIADEDDEDGIAGPQRKGRKLLNYDLQLLCDHVQDSGTQQVVVAFDDTEAFESELLSEIIELLGYWRDRIPFAFLFSLATSVEFLQQRLSKAALRCLDGKLFDVAPAGDEIEGVLESITHEDARLWIGSNLASMALERHHDYIQSVDSFVDAIHYAHMSHYYANPLSIFLTTGLKSKDVPSDHFEALRCLDSFRRFAQRLLGNDETGRLRDLLESDDILLGFVREKVGAAQTAMCDLMKAINVLRCLQLRLPATSVSSLSNLYVQAMSGKLQGSALTRSLLLSIRKTPSDVATLLLSSLSTTSMPRYLLDDCAELEKELGVLMRDGNDSAQPLRSEDDLKNSTLRTTVVAQKVELSKQKSSLSKEDAAYTALLRRFTDMLERYFADTLVNPKDLVFHEIFMYDPKSPHREVFTPRPRHAIERALAAPHDYLDCDCCAPGAGEGDESTLAATQPATAVLYQLYLESGSLINASDLWQAFQAVMGDEKSDEQAMALFQRALAELRYLGLVKTTRKRADHVAKVAWKGL